MKKKILIVSGDPNSINSEIIFKAWKKLNKVEKKKIYLISNSNLLKKQFLKLKYSLKIENVNNILEKENSSNLKVLNIKLKFKNPFKVNRIEASNFVINSLNYAHKYCSENQGVTMINCPISKKLLKKNKIGVTEFLAAKCNVERNAEVMLIGNKKLSVSPLTTHIDINEVSKKINFSLITKKIQTINYWLKKRLKRKPRIGVLGLNPHNAELRKNSKEKKIIIPAIIKLKRIGINVKGPLTSDTIFMGEHKNYDVIVGMYHDQVLSPFKSIYKFDAINITLGLKYLRVSPDHGTAINLIGKNRANPTSLIKCIEFLK